MHRLQLLWARALVPRTAPAQARIADALGVDVRAMPLEQAAACAADAVMHALTLRAEQAEQFDGLPSLLARVSWEGKESPPLIESARPDGSSRPIYRWVLL